MDEWYGHRFSAFDHFGFDLSLLLALFFVLLSFVLRFVGFLLGSSGGSRFECCVARFFASGVSSPVWVGLWAGCVALSGLAGSAVAWGLFPPCFPVSPFFFT